MIVGYEPADSGSIPDESTLTSSLQSYTTSIMTNRFHYAILGSAKEKRHENARKGKTMLTIFTNLYRQYECKDQALLSKEQCLEVVRSYKIDEFRNIVAIDVGL